MSDPTDGSPPGSAVPGILQARALEWVAVSLSNRQILRNNIVQCFVKVKTLQSLIRNSLEVHSGRESASHKMLL